MDSVQTTTTGQLVTDKDKANAIAQDRNPALANRRRRLAKSAALAFGITLTCAGMAASPAHDAAVSIAPQTMQRIATVSPRYQSYNVESAEVIGGNFWKPTVHASIAVFRKFAKTTVPDMLTVGPGSVGEGVLMPKMASGSGMASGLVKTVDMLSATPRPVFDVFSYHFYGAASLRCAAMGAQSQTAAADALSDAWLDLTVKSHDFYVKGLRDRFEPGKPVWITETADAACGGNPWAATFLDSFRYLNQMGRLAQLGVQIVFHNTLASSEYGLLDSDTFEPRSSYRVALLWHRLMGSTVLDAGPSRAGLHMYAQCTPGHPGGII